jgi:hypothetical protein
MPFRLDEVIWRFLGVVLKNTIDKVGGGFAKTRCGGTAGGFPVQKTRILLGPHESRESQELE